MTTIWLPDRPAFRKGACLLVALALSLLSLGSQASSASTRFVSVIVQALSARDARSAVEADGGKVTLNLPMVSGVAARVPADRVGALRATPGVRYVSMDGKVQFQGSGDPSLTPRRVQKIVGSDRLWNAGDTGRGVTVAVLDTGIYASHPDLQGPGGSRVIGCVDFSSEAGGQAGCKDTFGHGTFMAGLIAGNGASSGGKYMGAAPDANLVSVKVAGFDGSADVSHVLAGIQWVVAHQAQYGIRVLNLSLGSDSSQDYRLSPLDFAVERAWKAGIAVVVSAGNTGPGAHTITKPADDPYVITVGAENDEGSIAIGDDQVPVFSGRGPTRSNGFTKPDIVAPGVHTVSLRDPGSAIDQKYGASATIDGNYFRGTGTSMSAATVSGVVAQMLQADPTLTPDQVKYRLMQTAQPIADANPNNAGRGVVDAYGAATSSMSGSANQGLTPSSGLGSIEADRGSLHVSATTPAGQAALSGEFVALSDPAAVGLTNPKGFVPWVGLTYATTGWDATTWNATTWNATTWNATVDATTWNATTWNATTWNATTWNATTWNATTWNGTTWNDSDWNATTWNTTNWDATTWNATTWNSAWYAAAWN